MRIIYLDSIDKLTISPSVATIGFFDGVHRGHRFLIDHVVKMARSSDLEATVITFDRHPRQVLHADYQPQMLSTLDEKLAHLRQTALDNVVVLHFDEQLARLSARDFMASVLLRQLNVRKLVMGYDNRFGHNRAETFDDYVRYGAELGIEVVADTALAIDEVNVSSSVVRRFVESGNLPMANACLGYPYQIQGVVVPGLQNGRKMGFPTANIDVSGTGKLLPESGVYAVRVRLEDNETPLGGMINIGIRPTFNGKKMSMEVHLFDFDGNLYGKRLSVTFYKRIRGERKFNSMEALSRQLADDKRVIEALLESVDK